MNRYRKLPVFALGLFFATCSFPLLAAPFLAPAGLPAVQEVYDSQVVFTPAPLLLAEAAEDRQPEPGSLVIPGENGDGDKDKKQCLTVCKQWGEDCIINPRTGARNCRRTCKEFGEECF